MAVLCEVDAVAAFTVAEAQDRPRRDDVHVFGEELVGVGTVYVVVASLGLVPHVLSILHLIGSSGLRLRRRYTPWGISGWVWGREPG